MQNSYDKVFKVQLSEDRVSSLSLLIELILMMQQQPCMQKMRRNDKRTGSEKKDEGMGEGEKGRGCAEKEREKVREQRTV